MDMRAREDLKAKIERVRELVDLLEHYGEKGWCLPLNFKKQEWDQESGWEESDRHQYDIYKYHTESTIESNL